MDGSTAGALAFVGSGEYTPAMRETDLALLETLGGPRQARVVVLPTAAGLESPSSPASWARMGIQHFAQLDAPVQAAMILNRADAYDQRWLSMLRDANFFYFSGGNPQHVVESMQGTPAWELIATNHANGAVLAGCSAGAMAFGGWTVSIGSLRAGRLVQFVPALGIVPSLTVIPHFDRMARFVPAGAFNMMLKSAPQGVTAIGADEDTALVRLPPASGANGSIEWRVMGRQTVTVFDRKVTGGKSVYTAGQSVPLMA